MPPLCSRSTNVSHCWRNDNNKFTVFILLFFIKQEKGSNEISLKAMGRAINKTVMIAELIKVGFLFPLVVSACLLANVFVFIFFFLFQRRIAGLHQDTAIGSTDITDVWEPLEEGLLP